MRLQEKMADPGSRSQQIGAALLYGTFGLLMFGPMAFGAVEPWAIFTFESGSLLLLLLWLAKQWVEGEITILWNPLFLPMAAFGVLVLIQVIFGMTAYRHDTVAGAMLFVAYGLVCFVATQVLTRASQARQLAPVLAVYGFALAGFALLQGVSSNGKLYWLRQPRMGGWIYGPYVNHNHYAGIMELLVPIPLIISLSRMAPERARTASGVAAAVMVGTIFLSGSRGGMLAIFVELAALAFVLFRQKKTLRIAIAATAFVVVLTGMLAWLGGQTLTARLASISSEARGEISGGMRLSIDRDAVRMFRQKPLTGWGLGTFPVVYPQFRSFYTNFFVNQAHNDYLQLLAETGVVGFAIMLWFVTLLYRRALRKVKSWTSDVPSAAALVCVLGSTGILIHSLFDFNLQIPANAAFFYVYCVIAAGAPLQQRARKRKPEPAEEDVLIPASEVV